MKTYIPKKGNIEKKWLLVDAKGKTLGRLATQVAMILRGKNKPTFTPHMITSDYVVVINAKEINVTGNKMDQKIYYRHSGYLGGLKQATLKEKMEKDPVFAVKHAISGMIPRNKLKKEIMNHLKVFAGEEHAHEGQKPQKIEI